MVLKSPGEALPIFKRYLKSLGDLYCRKNNCRAIGLHNALSFVSYEQFCIGKLFFDDLTCFIVDRDPRDMWLNYSIDSYSRYLPDFDDYESRALAFVNFYRNMRADKVKFEEDVDVHMLQFENLCMDQDALRSIFFPFKDFLGEHQYPEKFFSARDSKDNIGLWKKASGKQALAIQIIERELPEYLWYDL